MDKQEHEKPGKDLISLPPIIPELKVQLYGSNSPIDRVYNLVWQGYSTVVYAQENQLPRKNRYFLSLAFENECHFVLGLVSDISKSCESINAQERLNLYKDYESLCQSLENLVKEYLSSDHTIPPGKVPPEFLKLNHSLRKLLRRGDLISSIHWEDALKRALQSSSSELAKLRPKPVKQPAEKERDTTPAKRERESWLWRLYEKTLKVIVEAVLGKVWPK